MLHKVKMLGQLAILTGIYLLGNRLAQLTGIPIPGNVVGVVLLYALLALGIIKLAWVQDAADFLIRHLIFFFIPVAVDLMNWGGVFARYGVRLALAIGVSTVLTFLVTGHLAQWLRGRERKCRG